MYTPMATCAKHVLSLSAFSFSESSLVRHLGPVHSTVTARLPDAAARLSADRLLRLEKISANCHKSVETN